MGELRTDKYSFWLGLITVFLLVFSVLDITGNIPWQAISSTKALNTPTGYYAPFASLIIFFIIVGVIIAVIFYVIKKAMRG